MAEDSEYDEDEVKLLLLEADAASHARALELIDVHLREAVCGWLRKGNPGLRSRDLAYDVWQETLLSVWEHARDGSFAADGTLHALILTIAQRRAIDYLRRGRAFRRMTTDEVSMQAIAEALKRTQVGLDWQQLTPAERHEIQEAIIVEVQKLPEKQRVVMQEFVDGFPETYANEVLRERVTLRTGKEETIGTVKRARQEALQKLQEQLARKKVGP